MWISWPGGCSLHLSGPLACLGSATSLRVSLRQSLNRRQSRRVVVAASKSRLREYVANRDSLINKWNPQAWWRPPDSTKPLSLTVTLFDLVISSDPSETCPILLPQRTSRAGSLRPVA